MINQKEKELNIIIPGKDEEPKKEETPGKDEEQKKEEETPGKNGDEEKESEAIMLREILTYKE